MHRGWRDVRWGDVSELRYGRALKGYREGTGDVEVYGTNGPVGWTDSTPLGEGPRPIVGRKGAYRGVHLAVGPFWVIDTAYWLEPTPDLDPRWAYYKLLTVDINGMDSGSAIPSLTRSHFEALPLLLPPVEEQGRIAGMLGALDELIDANRFVADTCAELAVQIAARSADRVVLDEIAIMAKLEQFSPSGRVDHYSIPAFDQARLPERVDGATIKSGKQKLTDPTVLVSRLNPQTQRVWMAYPSDVAAGASTEFVPLHARDQITIEEVWAVCAADAFGGQMRAHTTGTTGSHQRVNKAAIPTLRVPDVRVLDDNKRAMIVSLVRETHASLTAAAEVAAARDELLPLLLSGRVRVDEVAG